MWRAARGRQRGHAPPLPPARRANPPIAPSAPIPIPAPLPHRHTGDRRIPVLRLSGLWLEQFGFSIGSKLQIIARAGELVAKRSWLDAAMK
ncbi:type I toxin-antitoxin system SymE family toxin [Xanthomonas sp. NCPPB 2654]|uniref:type I toxin-antitoxin system SymE family toxin n=1 Tax=Xanthomonas sp. CFBP 8443 TaxID=2971235 RepID=UPI0021E0C2FE|nr:MULTISPECIES: type I toxin-antitoxin system SymE family toxin [unclassified Xanthomonas]MDL5366569.1 type I toxin-antitoxin system SymE family toxin [Xanthomonas sp. NCPPB 2654]UYC22799.1 type I toxin-antitoxin system SymE family toxin [Xanthomonas sp. CFBP 8443]